MRFLVYLLLYAAVLLCAQIILGFVISGFVPDPALLWFAVRANAPYIALPLALSATAALIAAVWFSRPWRTAAAVAGAVAVPIAAGWIWFGGYAETLIGAGLALGLLAPQPRAWLTGSAGGVTAAAPSLTEGAGEAQRLLVSAARLGRYPGIDTIEEESRNPTLAAPMALGVSRGEVLAAARERHGEQVRMNLAYLLPALVFVAAFATGAFWLAVPAVAGSAWLAVRSLWRDKYQLAPRFAAGRYATEPITDTAVPNLVTYRGYYPLSTFGFGFYDLCIAVDIARPAKREGYPVSASPSRPRIGEMEERVAVSLSRAGMVETAMELFLAQGSNLHRSLASGPDGRPPASIDPEHGRALARQPDSKVRRYIWLRRVAWEGNLQISYFLRIVEAGDDLVIELHATYLPPIGHEFRFVDTIPPRRFRTDCADIVQCLFMGPMMCAISSFALAGDANAAWRQVTGADVRRWRRAAEVPSFDHGAPESLRSQAARVAAMQHFQAMDRLAVERAFTGRILRECIDYLDQCGIDTSELREQRNAIINQGVIVQGGNINATNVAAGAGARIKQTVARAVTPRKAA